MSSIATVSGTALVPGVSKNGRLYTRELIAKAVARAQDRLAEGTVPLTCLTHHAAGDDSTRIVGSLTALSLAEDGSFRFTAELADTDHARTIAGLVSGPTPHLKGVSIRGAWLGNVRRERFNGQTVETADDLEIDGLDYTRSPGVPGAHIDTVQTPAGAPAESADGRHLIYESAEALVTTLTEETTGTEAETPPAQPNGPFADPGYLPDRQKRFPLGSKTAAMAAWAALGESGNTYTGPQSKRIRGRIVKTLREHGVTVAADRWLIDPVGRVDGSTPVGEMLGMYGDSEPGSFCLNATNGPLSVSVSSYCIDPADLELILHAVVDGAVSALKAIDPDMDADMDVPGADAEDTDGDMGGESAPAATLAEATPQPTPQTPEEPAPAGDTETPAPEADAANPNDEEEPAMADSAPQAVEPAPVTPVQAPAAAPTITLSADQFEQLLGKFTAPVPVAAETAPVPAGTTTETDPEAAPATAEPVAETTEQMVARLVAEGVKAALPAAVQEHVVQNGPPTRKGLVEPVTEHTAPVGDTGLPEGWPAKPLHQYTEEEWRQYASPATVGAILGARATQ